MKNPLKRLYAWVLSWADTPYGIWALFLLAFTESSFFPVPPDILLIALAISQSKKAFKYALVCSVGSVIGGCFGYLIGYGLYDSIGKPIIEFYNLGKGFEQVRCYYLDNTFLTVIVAGFTPIPYKIFTIAAGFCRIDFWTFLIASAISRSARFFLVSTILYFVGPKAKIFIDKYFNLLTIIFTVLLIAGFIILKYLIK